MTQTSAPTPPATGTAITRQHGRLVVPDHPIIPFIEGDGTGPDIWRASVRVLDAAIDKAYGGKRKIAWMEVYAGEKSFKQFSNWLPDDTVEAFRHYLVGIKGPLTTPVGGGIRSLNVALRQLLDLFVCLRPVRWYNGVPRSYQLRPCFVSPLNRSRRSARVRSSHWRTRGAGRSCHYVRRRPSFLQPV